MIPTRRDFLRTSAMTGSLVSWGWTVPLFLNRTAMAAPTAARKGAKDTILVVVELNGGNDGLNTVIPFADQEYEKLRPTLKVTKSEVKKLNDQVGLHPSMGSFAGLLQDHSLCVVQGVGYPNPSQSHFRSMDIWQAGSTDETLTEGWIGRGLKAIPNASAFHLAENNNSAPLALAGAPVRAPSIISLDQFQLQTTAASGSDRRQQRDFMEGVAVPTLSQPRLLDFVKRTAVETYQSSKRLQEIGKNYQPKVPYPNSPLANKLKLAAQLIDADLGARIFYVSFGGFDTHANQAASHGNLLGTISDAMSSFYKDMAARGHKERILMMTFSEFGRRAKENGSRGTDHGSAAPIFLVGGKVKPGVVGNHPSLTRLEMGNLQHHTDFRQVYAAILEQWLGINSKQVLGGGFKPLEILKA